MESCFICSEDIKSQKLVCPKCNYKESCDSCQMRFLLDSKESKCMNCSMHWSDDFIKEKTPANWFKKDYRNHVSEQLCKIEREKLPIAAKYLILLNEYENNKKVHKEIRERIRFEDISDEEKKTLEAKTKRIWSRNQEILRVNYPNFVQELNPDYVYVKNCEKKETLVSKKCTKCIGYCVQLDIKSIELECGTCKNVACAKCYEDFKEEEKGEKGEKHVCKPETIETIKNLKKDKSLKQCPKCNSFIEKTNGCDQMLCLECKTTFSWTTGQIETGVFHNPHLYEWLSTQKNGQEILRNYRAKQMEAKKSAEADPNHCDNYNGFGHYIFNGDTNLNYFTRMMESYSHVSPVTKDILKKTLDLPREYCGFQAGYMSNQKIFDTFGNLLLDKHLQFLQKKITEDEWKRQIFLEYARRDYRIELYNRFNTHVFIVGTLVMNFYLSHIKIFEANRRLSENDLVLSCLNLQERYAQTITMYNKSNVELMYKQKKTYTLLLRKEEQHNNYYHLINENFSLNDSWTRNSILSYIQGKDLLHSKPSYIPIQEMVEYYDSLKKPTKRAKTIAKE